MTESSLLIRPFQTEDEDALVALWKMCELTVPCIIRENELNILTTS